MNTHINKAAILTMWQKRKLEVQHKVSYIKSTLRKNPHTTVEDINAALLLKFGSGVSKHAIKHIRISMGLPSTASDSVNKRKKDRILQLLKLGNMSRDGITTIVREEFGSCCTETIRRIRSENGILPVRTHVEKKYQVVPPSDAIKSMGLKIKQFRRMAGFTINRLSKRTGVSSHLIIRLERGEAYADITFSTLRRICLACQQPLDELFTYPTLNNQAYKNRTPPQWFKAKRAVEEAIVRLSMSELKWLTILINKMYQNSSYEKFYRPQYFPRNMRRNRHGDPR